MNELIVIGYDTPEAAEAARTELFGMSQEYLVDVADAVVATADADGKIKLNQMVNTWTVGATGGAFWGLLVGMLFFNPLLGVAVGAGAGALSGALTDYGINDDFMKDKRLGIKGGHILRTNLDRSKEDHLRRAFNETHAGISADTAA